jgi:hypothetical protein
MYPTLSLLLQQEANESARQALTYFIRFSQEEEMRTHRDAKLIARALREALKQRKIDLSHSDCLEIVARQFGFENWNIFASKLAPDKVKGKKDPAILLPRPKDWFPSGSSPDLYEMAVDKSVRHSSGHPAVIRRIGDGEPASGTERQFGTLMQSVQAKDFAGKKVELSAELKTDSVTGTATIWMRADDQRMQLIAFDNMEKRTTDGALRGTNEWTKRQIVLEIPEAAESLHFGFYLSGFGTVWAAGFDLREASADALPTRVRHLLPKPSNLRFKDLRDDGLQAP